MTLARPATIDDVAELIRLRKIMMSSLSTDSGTTEWVTAAEAMLRKELSDPEGVIGVFVVDAGDALSSCAIGMIQQRLPGPRNPTGLTGYIGNVSTDPRYRRRGHSRACVSALLEWFRQRGVRRADLRSSAEAEPLYTELGFSRTPDPSMAMPL